MDLNSDLWLRACGGRGPGPAAAGGALVWGGAGGCERGPGAARGEEPGGDGAPRPRVSPAPCLPSGQTPALPLAQTPGALPASLAGPHTPDPTTHLGVGGTHSTALPLPPRGAGWERAPPPARGTPALRQKCAFPNEDKALGGSTRTAGSPPGSRGCGGSCRLSQLWGRHVSLPADPGVPRQLLLHSPPCRPVAPQPHTTLPGAGGLCRLSPGPRCARPLLGPGPCLPGPRRGGHRGWGSLRTAAREGWGVGSGRAASPHCPDAGTQGGRRQRWGLDPGTKRRPHPGPVHVHVCVREGAGAMRGGAGVPRAGALSGSSGVLLPAPATRSTWALSPETKQFVFLANLIPGNLMSGSDTPPPFPGEGLTPLPSRLL